MKKLAVIFFFGALVVGVIGAQMSSFGRLFDLGAFKVNFNRGVEGSGNVIREQRDIADFDSVEVGGAFVVEITSGPAFSVEVEADDNIMPLITTSLRNQTLNIEAEKNYHSKHRPKILISMPGLRRIDTSGAANVAAQGIKAGELLVESSGGSRVTLSGEAKELKIDISGGAKVEAAALSAQKAGVDTSGGATAEVNVIESLDASASGGSRIFYSGSPASVARSASGGAKILQR